MEEFIEVLFAGNDTYVHEAGDLNFHGTNACIMFRDGGTMQVKKDAYLQYGDGGEGILALGKGAKVDLVDPIRQEVFGSVREERYIYSCGPSIRGFSDME